MEILEGVNSRFRVRAVVFLIKSFDIIHKFGFSEIDNLDIVSFWMYHNIVILVVAMINVGCGNLLCFIYNLPNKYLNFIIIRWIMFLTFSNLI